MGSVAAISGLVASLAAIGSTLGGCAVYEPASVYPTGYYAYYRPYSYPYYAAPPYTYYGPSYPILPPAYGSFGLFYGHAYHWHHDGHWHQWHEGGHGGWHGNGQWNGHWQHH